MDANVSVAWIGALSAVAVVTFPLLLRAWLDDRRRRQRIEELVRKLDRVDATTEYSLKPNGGSSIPDALGRIERDVAHLGGLLSRHQQSTLERLDSIHSRVDRVEAKVDKLTDGG